MSPIAFVLRAHAWASESAGDRPENLLVENQRLVGYRPGESS